MDAEIEDFLDPNNTDELDSYLYTPTGWDYAQDTFICLYTLVGLFANIILIYIIAYNVQMRTKTNLILLNWAINDLCFLFVNMHFLTALYEFLNLHNHASLFSECMLHDLDSNFQFNEAVFILIMLSNTLMKNVRVKINTLLISLYSFAAVNYLLHQIICHSDESWFPIIYILCLFALLLIFGIVVLKEFNSCYKKCYKKDPLTKATQFRFNIGRIYSLSWFMTVFFYAMHFFREVTYLLAPHSLMTSAYILGYVVYADKNFKICFLNILHCRGYDVNDTITFAEDDSEREDHNNQGNV